jgi:chromosome segregation ATPase
MARFAAEAHGIQADHQRELDSKDAIMQDILTAMSSEEQAKIAAQGQLRTCKDRAIQLEQELASATSQLDDIKERCKDLEMERDEAQVCSCCSTAVHAWSVRP